jgi:dipeptide/tripeptide permease
MELNFDIRRLLLLAVLLGGFALLGGFTPPEPAPHSMHNTANVRKAWTYCVALYIFGAAAASLTDHWAGTMEPVNLRPVYILVGGLLMLAGGLWLRSLKESVEPKEQTVFVGPLDVIPLGSGHFRHALIT